MASHKDFADYVSEQLRDAGTIRSRKMFGEYGLYCDEVFFAVICDDRLFVKITPEGEAAFPALPKAPPYEGARDSFLVEDVEDRDTMTALVRLTCLALRSQPRKGRKSPPPACGQKTNDTDGAAPSAPRENCYDSRDL